MQLQSSVLCTNALRAVIAFGSKIMLECGESHRITPCEKNHPQLRNVQSNENVEWYSVTLRTTVMLAYGVIIHSNFAFRVSVDLHVLDTYKYRASA